MRQDFCHQFPNTERRHMLQRSLMKVARSVTIVTLSDVDIRH
jgi:hypothetical protein